MDRAHTPGRYLTICIMPGGPACTAKVFYTNERRKHLNPHDINQVLPLFMCGDNYDYLQSREVIPGFTVMDVSIRKGKMVHYRFLIVELPKGRPPSVLIIDEDSQWQAHYLRDMHLWLDTHRSASVEIDHRQIGKSKYA